MRRRNQNVFISHVHEDDRGLGDLKDLLSRRGLSVRDSSVTQERPNQATSPEYIKNDILAPRITWAGTLIVYISPDTKDSQWVNWEIEYAQRHDKRIIGVWERGANECPVPEALDKYADAVVGWNTDRILDALDGRLTDWQRPDGTPRPPRPIARHACA